MMSRSRRNRRAREVRDEAGGRGASRLEAGMRSCDQPGAPVRFLLSILFFAGLAIGVWWAFPEPGAKTSAATVSWELADIRELGELRLLTTEIASLQRVTTIDPGRFLTVVIPVRVTLGMDLARAVVRREGDDAVVTLPAVRHLRRSSDPNRWNIWETRGALQAPGEAISLAQLAELQAFNEADGECVRLGLPAKVRTRAEAVIDAWLRGLGAQRVRFSP